MVFADVDFGEYGSDEITLPIFALSDSPCEIEFWLGKAGEKDSRLLDTLVYQKTPIWNVYQEQTFVFPRRLTGVTSLTMRMNHKVHIKGFCFEKQEKAWSSLSALQADAIYGDTFTREADAVTGIGNNVSLEFGGMDFAEGGHAVSELTGPCPIDKNTIHTRSAAEHGRYPTIAEFDHTEDYATKRFDVTVLPGTQKVVFLFLPGCDFDFKSFRFVSV